MAQCKSSAARAIRPHVNVLVAVLAVLLLLILCATGTAPVSATRYMMVKRDQLRPPSHFNRAMRIGSSSRGNLFTIVEVDEQALNEEYAKDIFATVRNAVLVGEFNATQHTIGWATQKVITNGAASDEDQAYATGYFEGKSSAKMVWHHWYNHYHNRPVSNRVNKFMLDNLAWIRSQSEELNETDSYWMQVGLMVHQFDGLLDGVNDAADAGETFATEQLLQLTAMGDIFDLEDALADDTAHRRNMSRFSPDEFETWFADNTHCSALFKVPEDLSDIYFGHTSWYNYNTMLRIFKQMTLNFKDGMTAAHTLSYSSYPGMLSSFDDFYTTNNGFAVIETSIAVMNSSLYDGNIREDTVPYWARIMVATRTVTSGPNWVDTFKAYNSGTYNNQWMVLNMNLFTPGKELKDGTLWVAEQLPGIVKGSDVTNTLRYGYFPSYNVPMDPEMYEISGYRDATEKQGPAMNSYQLCVRARIFRRDQGKVKDIESFKKILTYNRYESDPISNGNAMYAIASRRDFLENPTCGGNLDSKVSSYSLWKDGQTVLAQCGPTQQQPVFAFDTASPKIDCGLHEGVPNKFNFTWQTMKP